MNPQYLTVSKSQSSSIINAHGASDVSIQCLIALGSDIHDIHVDVFHKSSHDGLWDFWGNQASQIKDWNNCFEYNPYAGRLPPGVEG